MSESNHGIAAWFLNSWESLVLCSISMMLLATIDVHLVFLLWGFFNDFQLHYEEVSVKAMVCESSGYKMTKIWIVKEP